MDLLEVGMEDSSSLEMNLNNMSISSTSHQWSPNIMILVWNYRSLGNDNAVDAVKDIIDAHHPNIVILTETRITLDRSERVAASFHYDGYLAMDIMGF